jgi:phosphoribosylanthranilate isomerase
MTRTKICGVRTEEQAIAAAGAGVDFIGLVFAPSPRQVTPDVAAKIKAALKKRRAKTEMVGVFVNVHAETVNRVCEMCGLDRAQLSGDEPWEYCREIEKPVIKAIRVTRDHSPEQVMKDIDYGLKILKGREIIILLDTGVPERYGGTGETFDWELARLIAREFPVVIAGGLTPGNVAQAIKTVSPWGVDVSTGVETGGIKDLKKIRKFIAAVRQADAGAR